MATDSSANPQQRPASSVPLLDVNRGNEALRGEILQAIARVYDSGRFVGGPDCQQLEQGVAKLCETDFAIGCASGSDALLLALMAFEIGPGDEVIVPSFTFFATASVVWRLGATPVFADIDPVSFNLDPASLEAAVTAKTKAVIPVHLFGQCADMNAINEIVRRHSLYVIEDAAQAIGARYQGRPAGSLGSVACFSFYPTKNLGGLGDGGMLTTSDAKLAERLRLLAAHGMSPRYYHSVVGVNSRLDSIQAAALNVKLNHLAECTKCRQENAARYQQLFSATSLTDRQIEVPVNSTGGEHVWNQFTIRVGDAQRDALRAQLAETGIGSEIYYPVPLHQQRCFRDVPLTVSLDETERATTQVLSLPIFPELTEIEQQRVVRQISAFLDSYLQNQNTARRLAS